MVTLEAIRCAGQVFPFQQLTSFAETYLMQDPEDSKIYFGIPPEAYGIYKSAIELLSLSIPELASALDHTLQLKVQDATTYLIYTCEVSNFGSVYLKDNHENSYPLILFEYWNNH